MKIPQPPSDRLGQIIFRLETNFNTFVSSSVESTKVCCVQSIKSDLELLKEFKKEMISTEEIAALENGR
jgi:hypothetical protein